MKEMGKRVSEGKIVKLGSDSLCSLLFQSEHVGNDDNVIMDKTYPYNSEIV